MKCPNCGSDVASILDLSNVQLHERITAYYKWGGIACSNCPAVLRVSYEDSEAAMVGIVLDIMLSFGLTILLWSYKVSTFIPVVLILEISIGFFLAIVASNKRKMVIVRLRPTCRSCGITIDADYAEFCPNCGTATATEPETSSARMPTRISGIQQDGIPVSKHIGSCMVCNLDLRPNDPLSWCPHCGRIAHRAHLLEWVHVKRNCPACGQHLDEREVSQQPSGGPLPPSKKRKTWRTI